jgi:hypothetical protein
MEKHKKMLLLPMSRNEQKKGLKAGKINFDQALLCRKNTA